jgi:hypothetical protein
MRDGWTPRDDWFYSSSRARARPLRLKTFGYYLFLRKLKKISRLKPSWVSLEMTCYYCLCEPRKAKQSPRGRSTQGRIFGKHPEEIACLRRSFGRQAASSCSCVTPRDDKFRSSFRAGRGIYTTKPSITTFLLKEKNRFLNSGSSNLRSE